MIRAGLAAVMLAMAGTMTAGCGDAPSELPEPAPCTTATPFPTSRAGGSAPSGQVYRQAMTRGVDRLNELLFTFRAKWPEGKFNRQAAFRTDFVKYADESICVAKTLTAAPRPSDAYADFMSALTPAVDAFIKTQGDGRSAVGARNVSDYRDWNKSVDERMATLASVMQQLPANPPRGPQ